MYAGEKDYVAISCRLTGLICWDGFEMFYI